MMPDPNRQWFVYFKDKEMGPFSEADLHSKLKAGEIDGTAYVFTEGMSDWALVSDTAIFAAKGPAVSAVPPASGSSTLPLDGDAPLEKEGISSAPGAGSEKLGAKGVTKSAEPTLLQKAAKGSGAAAAAKKAAPVRRGLIYGILGVVIVVAGVFYWIDQGGQIPFLSPPPKPVQIRTPPKPTTAVAPEGEVASGTQAAMGAPAASVPVTKVVKNADWDELRDFRKTEDPKGAPFRISSHSGGDAHPIIVGVLSPLIKATTLRIAIFPDNDRNLMPVSKIWRMSVTVLDGYFTAGPLNVEGAELPPGRYHLMVATGSSFLGEVTFDVGTWPEQAKLTEMQLQMQKDRGLMADKERTALEVKLRETTAAVDQLKVHAQSAAQGPKGAREWRNRADSWKQNMYHALEDQRSVMSGPMFYPDVQSKLYALMTSAYKTVDDLDIVSKGGPKALAREKKKTVGQLWLGLQGELDRVAGEIRILGQGAPGPLKIDPSVIKRQIIESK